MPRRSRKPCCAAGCPALTRGRFCDKHQSRSRGNVPRRRLYDLADWRKARVHYLRDNPLCVDCLEAGRTTAATEVDHVIPHRGDRELFWQRSNWAAMCKSCHSKKTYTETLAG